jgi:hypothetical protein
MAFTQTYTSGSIGRPNNPPFIAFRNAGSQIRPVPSQFKRPEVGHYPLHHSPSSVETEEQAERTAISDREIGYLAWFNPESGTIP